MTTPIEVTAIGARGYHADLAAENRERESGEVASVESKDEAPRGSLAWKEDEEDQT